MNEIEKRDEVHGKNQIILTVFQVENGFSFSVQCKVSRIIRSIFPHQIKEIYKSPLDAKHAAFELLLSWVKHSRTARQQLFCFDLVNVDQPDLFPPEELIEQKNSC